MGSLRRRFFQNSAVWIVGLIMLLLAGVVAYAYASFRREATQQILTRDQQLAVLSASRLQSDLKDFADLLTAVARTRAVSEGGVATQMAGLRAGARRLDVFDGGIVLLDDRGWTRGTLPERPDFTPQDWSDRDFFRAVLGGAPMYASDAHTETPGGDLVVTIAVPILGPDGNFAGALVGVFPIGAPTTSAFYGSLVKLHLGESGETLVIDSHGRIIFGSDPNLIGHYLVSAELPLIADPQSAAAGLMRDRRGKQVVAAHAPVPGTGWTLASLEDWGIVTQSTARYRNILMIAVVAALLLPPLSQVVASRQQRIRFLEMRRPEDDEAWARVMRDQLHPRLLPVLPGWQLLAHGQAGKRREHDFVDAAILPDGRLMLSIGTVLGSGLPAALAIASTRTLLRASGQRLESLEQSLTQCSASLCLQLEPPLPVRCLVIRLDPRSGWLDYACAGASPLGAEGNHVLQWASPSGDAMGAVPEPRIEVGRVHLDPGGLMLVTGQAMAETHDAEGRSFIQEVLSHLLKEDRLGLEDLAHKVQRAFRSFNQSSRHLDPDMTILLLERRPSPS